MTISPAQIAVLAAMPERLRDNRQAQTLPLRSLPTAAAASPSPAQGTPPAEAAPSGPVLSINLRIDDQHRMYYEVINNHTGEVLYQIPPEVIRKLGEDTEAALEKALKAHTLDVRE